MNKNNKKTIYTKPTLELIDFNYDIILVSTPATDPNNDNTTEEDYL